MLLVEIAAQGLKAVSLPGGALRLRPGYNVVATDGAALRRLVEALFYPEPQDGVQLRAVATTPGAARAGVTFVADDGLTYRLVRDFAVGCQLHRFDPQKRAFGLVAQGSGADAAKVTAQAGFPARASLAFLSAAATDLPSRRSAVAGAAAALPKAKPLTPEQAQARLAELKDELVRAKKSAELQYHLDGLQSRLFKLEEALREKGRIREEVARAEGALTQAGPVAEVAERLGDVDAKIAGYKKATGKHDEAVQRAQDDRSAWETQLQQTSGSPFWRDPRFWGGIAAAVAAVGAAIALSAGQGRYLVLLDIPAFGWAAWVALGWVSDLEAHERLLRRGKALDDHDKAIQVAFERETVEVRAAMKALRVSSADELLTALGAVAEARSAVAQARARLASYDEKPETRSAEEEKPRVEAELRDTDEALTRLAGGYMRDVRTIEQEIRRVEVQASGTGAEAAETAPAPVPSGDPLRELLDRAAAELGGSPVGAVRTVAQRAAQMLQALTGKRLDGVDIDDRGNLLVSAGTRRTPFAELQPPDRDAAYLALKFAFQERAFQAKAKQVALLDDALAALPDVARRVAGRILKQVAKPGQVVHATSDAAFRESADHTA